MVAAVDAPPRREGNDRERAGDAADNRIHPARREQRVVAALVQDDEPLHERERENGLSNRPGKKMRL
jgi:hypothetical protein